MRSRIPPTCPASPDYHRGLSSFEVAKNGHEKNFLVMSPTALIDGASPGLSAVPILNSEKRQRTLQNKGISDGVLYFRASGNFPSMTVSDGRPLQTEAQDAPGYAMKVNAGSNEQAFPTTPVGLMSEKVKQSPTKSSRGCGCRRSFSVRDEKPRKHQAGTATKKVSVVRPHTLPPERRHNASANDGERLPQIIRAYHERLNRPNSAGLSDREEPRCHSAISLEPSVFDIGNSRNNKRRRRVSDHASEVLSHGPSDEPSHFAEKVASNTTRYLSEEDDIDIKHNSSANKRCRRRSDGRFSHPSLDAGSNEQQLLPENSPSPAAVPVCSSAQAEAKECRRSSEASPRESPFGPVEFRPANADVYRSAPSSKEIKLDSREKLQTIQGHDTESGPLRQQPLPMDPHAAVELVLKLWQPLPPASSLLQNSKSVRQELRELLATRKQRSETLSTTTPSPSDSECRAFLFECLSAPLPAEEQCGEVSSGFVSAPSEESSWDRENNEATLCTSVPVTSLAVSMTAESNPFSFAAGFRHEGSLCTSGNETRPRRARRMHNPTPEGLVPPVAGRGEFTVTGGGGNAIQTFSAPTASSAGSPVNKFGIHQAGGSLLIGVEAAVNAPPIRGDKPHGNKDGSSGRPSHVHGTLASSFACHRHLQLPRSGETFRPAQKSVRFSHAEIVSGDRLAFRVDAKAPCNKCVPTNGRGAKGSSPRQSFLEKEQSFFPPSVANVAVQEKCVRLSLFSNKKYHGHENPLIQEGNICCEEVHASDTTEAYDGVAETSYSAMKTRSGRQVKLNHARFPGLRTSGEPVPA